MKVLVQGAGFEPAKRYAADLEPAPFDHSGTPAVALGWKVPLVILPHRMNSIPQGDIHPLPPHLMHLSHRRSTPRIQNLCPS